MSLATVHPEYEHFKPDWEMLRDFYAGPKKVRSRGTLYLPATDGMILDGMAANELGYKRYTAYAMRARVPDYVKEGVEVTVGLMHQKDAIIELPPELEYLRDRASNLGEPLTALHRRINVEQVHTGRVGLLVDMPRDPDPSNPQPYIALYATEAIRNWDSNELEDEESLQMVILDESGRRRDGFAWQDVEQYRVLELDEEGVYTSGTFNGETGLEYLSNNMIRPALRGKTLEEIPFFFINSKDMLPSPDEPPLKALAELCIGIYQSEADYRQNLFMQAQDTLVVIGGVRVPDGVPGDRDAIRTGAGARIDVEQGGDAKFIGVSATGLAEQRLAIKEDRIRAQIKAGELIQSGGSQQESGAALSTRFNAQTATLNQLAVTAAAGLQAALRTIARWVGADETKVKVTPNTEFIDFALEGQNFNQLMDAKTKGFPLSLRSLHALAADRGVTVVDYDTEIKHLMEEKALLESLLPKVAAPAQGTQPAGPKPKADPPADPPADE